MEISYFIGVFTIIITWILGYLAKKSKFINNNMIPIQNIIIGIVSFVVDYIITKDFNGALLFSGLVAGGSYDLLKSLKQISFEKED